MDCVENMRKVLTESGAYVLDGSSMVDQELEAYGAGLRTVEEEAQRLEGELFVLTASAERLGSWERLYRRQASWADIEVRRRGVAKALSCRGGLVLRGDLEGLLEAAGVKGSARMEDGKLIIHVEEYQGVTETEARRVLGRLMPLYIKWEIEV